MTNPIIYYGYSKLWYNSKNQYHRDNGPACDWDNGQKEWYQNGKRHREDGPAIEMPDGGKYWYINEGK